MKKIVLLLVFVIAVIGAASAQSVYDWANNSAPASYDGSGFNIQANTPKSGFFSFYTGPVASLLATGGSFSGNGGWFSYSIPNGISAGTTQNISGTISVATVSSNGGNTTGTYQISINFSGYDQNGHAFSGQTVQLMKMRTKKSGTDATVLGGSIEVQLN